MRKRRVPPHRGLNARIIERFKEIIYASMLGGAVGVFVIALQLPMLISYWGSSGKVMAFNVALGASCGFVLGPRWGRRAIGSLLIALELLALLVATTPVAANLARSVIRIDPVAPKADAVYVFGSSLRPNGDLTDVAQTRLLHGLEIVAEGRAPRLIVSELPPPRDGYADAARKLMRTLGLNQEVLSIGPVLRSHDESAMLGELFRKKGWKSVIVVTSPLHTRRACAIVEHEGLLVTCDPALETRFDLAGLKEADEKLAAFGHALHERVGLWYYKKRGWL